LERFRGPSQFSVEDRRHAWIIAKALIRRGASLDQSVCVVGNYYSRIGPTHWKAADQHIGQYLGAVDILQAVVNDDDVDELHVMLTDRGRNWTRDLTVQVKVIKLRPAPPRQSPSYTFSIDSIQMK
jgi:hypothetical protein